MSDKKNFEFPQKLLEQINECSDGGFVLFIIDSEGIPVAHSQCDTMMHLLALQNYVSTWSKTMEELNVDSLTDSFMTSDDGDAGAD